MSGTHRLNVLLEVALERTSQDAKWGEQNHDSGCGEKAYGYMRDCYREIYETSAVLGRVTWADVMLEEVYEALSEEDPKKLRAELLQVAAVAVAWVECLDRKRNDEQETSKHA